MEKSILVMVGGEKHITPHYDIKAENTSCYIGSKGFTGIEINGVRFSNIGEMLRYMNKQRTQLLKAKELLTKWIELFKPKGGNIPPTPIQVETEQFISETTELNKANEWHKVADGDLPKDARYVWTNVGAGYHDDDGWWDDFGRLQNVIAWCEPKFEE